MSRHHAKLDRRRWEATRRAAFKRDGYRCTACGKAGRLEAHHAPVPLAELLRTGGGPYRLAGIVTRCRDCHIREHEDDHVSPEQRAWGELLANLVRGAPE